MADPTLTERARAVLAGLTPYERAVVLWAHGEGSHVACIARTDVGRECARLLTEGADR